MFVYQGKDNFEDLMLQIFGIDCKEKTEIQLTKMPDMLPINCAKTSNAWDTVHPKEYAHSLGWAKQWLAAACSVWGYAHQYAGDIC